MPGIVELPTLEDLKVQEVRLVRRIGKRGTGLQLPGPGPSPACTPRTLGPGSIQYNPNQNPSRTHSRYNNLKFMWKGKDIKIVKAILIEKNMVGGLKLCDFKNYYKAAVITAVWY